MDVYNIKIENEKVEILKEELNQSHKVEEAKYYIKKCLYMMSISNNNEEALRSTYIELRKYVSLEEIEKVIAASKGNYDMDYIEERYLESISKRVVPEAQYKIKSQVCSLKQLIYLIIEETKGL